MEKVWLKQYQDGVPEYVDESSHESLAHMIESCSEKFRDNPSFTCMGKTMTFGEVADKARDLGGYLLGQAGLKKGDRVAGLIPNIPEAVVAMLATSAIGAIWSSASPDFGVKGVLDRFKQIKPKIIFTSNGYYYNGKKFGLINKLNSILKELPSVKKTIIPLVL